MATHSSVLAWRIPGTVEPGGLPSMGSHRVGHDWSDLAAAVWLISLSFIPCRSIHVVTDGKSLFFFMEELFISRPQVCLMSLVLDPSTPLPLQPSKNGIKLGICEYPFNFICLQYRRPGFDPWVRKIIWREGMATHSSILAWRIPWTEESGGLQSMGSQRVGHHWATDTLLFTFSFVQF